ncbi:hypothetical protein FACS189440_09910 [Bacteroidia bacterium]|nr:hypothetical protein FACS189423_00230 [Bacteroidia bacterium]GHT47891.1 hypothetical protein FACS189440_09910 [Bacteroidia bacterium]
MSDKDFHKFDGQKLGWFIFEAAMAVLYLVFAAVFLFPSLFYLHLAIQGGLGTALGIILAVYGIFRIYRVIKKLR